MPRKMSVDAQLKDLDAQLKDLHNRTGLLEVADDDPDPLEREVESQGNWLVIIYFIVALFVLAPFLYKWVPVAGKWVFCSNYEYISPVERLSYRMDRLQLAIDEIGMQLHTRNRHTFWFRSEAGDWIEYTGGTIAADTEVILDSVTYVTTRATRCDPSCDICYKRKGQ